MTTALGGTVTAAPRVSRIWWFALGYFACYIPYSALTKAVSNGYVGTEAVVGPAILPMSVAASVIGMICVLSIMRWWKYAHQIKLAGMSLPTPTRWTALSGVATSAIVITTTLSYTFEGISIIFAMLLMRGGVLMLAPVVDGLGKRKVRPSAWGGSILSLVALVVAFAEEGGYEITLVAAINIGIYLAAYFLRLRLMSKLAKTGVREKDIRYFVEEQMIATPLLMLSLAAMAIFGSSTFTDSLAAGFVDIWDSGAILWILLIGFFSQGTGLFGGLILLEPAENAYCVPINRSSSILAGLLATILLWLAFDAAPPSVHQLVGALIVIGAILVLSWPTLMAGRRRRKESTS